MSKTAKSVVIDITTNHAWPNIVGVRKFEFLLSGSLITVASGDITAYASSAYSGYAPADAFITSTSKTGPSQGASWASAEITPITSRLIVVFDSPVTFDEIVVNNYHNNGSGAEVGFNSTKITISPDEITDTTYNAIVSNGEEIFSDAIRAHVGSNIVDDDSIWVDDSTLAVQMALEQPYELAEDALRLVLEQVYGLKLESILKQVYRDADKVTSVLAQYYHSAAPLNLSFVQPYHDALAVQKALRQTWGRSLPLNSPLLQPYHLPATVQTELEQLYTLTEELIQAALAQHWSIRDVEALQRSFNQLYGLHDEGVTTAVSAPVVEVDNSGVFPAGGVNRLDPTSVNVEAGRDTFCWTFELQLATLAEYLQCIKGAELTIELSVGTFSFFIGSRRRTRKHSSTWYIVEGFSRSKLLDAPYAETINGELTGLASVIATDLAGEHTLVWQTVDWYIGPGTFFAADETPMTLIKRLANAVGAVVQTDPDGTLVVEPDYPVPVHQWRDVVAEYHLTDALDFFTTSETPDDRPGYNLYLVSDQLTTDYNLKLEEEVLSETSKYARGYQTPWVGNFDLSHTGGNWVRIEALSIENRRVEELVEVVAGTGQTSYPIYERLDMAWQQHNLGNVVFAEDGRLKADIEGESLLHITYRTKCLHWLVTDPRNEQLQLVVLEED